jgi:hypothetical protein
MRWNASFPMYRHVDLRVVEILSKSPTKSDRPALSWHERRTHLQPDRGSKIRRAQTVNERAGNGASSDGEGGMQADCPGADGGLLRWQPRVALARCLMLLSPDRTSGLRPVAILRSSPRIPSSQWCRSVRCPRSPQASGCSLRLADALRARSGWPAHLAHWQYGHANREPEDRCAMQALRQIINLLCMWQQER